MFVLELNEVNNLNRRKGGKRRKEPEKETKI
jgi:hypothetical protein